MKKLALSLLLLTIACSPEEQKTETCSTCKEVEQQFINNQWMSVGIEYPTAFTCISNGYTYGSGGYLSGTGQYISKRRVVVCK